MLVEYKNTFRRGPISKLLPFLKDPFLVISSVKSRYSLQDIITKRIQDYHGKRLTPFQLDMSKYDSVIVALRDNGDLFENMKGKATGPKAKLFFEVYWTGYPEPTWEPWSRVRTTLKLHEFLRGHKVKSVQNLVQKIFSETVNEVEPDSEEENNVTPDD